MKKDALEQTTISEKDQYCPCYSYIDGDTDPDCPMHGSKAAGQQPLSVILDEIEERAKKATEGPWAHCKGASVFAPAHRISKDVAVLLYVSDAHTNSEADFDFVASARTDVPALVKALRRAVEHIEGEGDSDAIKAGLAEIAAILNQK